jgi:hypothetical protein
MVLELSGSYSLENFQFGFLLGCFGAQIFIDVGDLG